jgi:hypothetical protein
MRYFILVLLVLVVVSCGGEKSLQVPTKAPLEAVTKTATQSVPTGAASSTMSAPYADIDPEANSCPPDVSKSIAHPEIKVQQAWGCLIYIPDELGGTWSANTNHPASLDDYRLMKAKLSKEIQERAQAFGLADPCSVIWALGPGLKEQAVHEDFLTDGCP